MGSTKNGRYYNGKANRREGLMAGSSTRRRMEGITEKGTTTGGTIGSMR